MILKMNPPFLTNVHRRLLVGWLLLSLTLVFEPWTARAQANKTVSQLPTTTTMQSTDYILVETNNGSAHATRLMPLSSLQGLPGWSGGGAALSFSTNFTVTGTNVDVSPVYLLLISNWLTPSILSSVAGNYYPLTGNPSGFLTAASALNASQITSGTVADARLSANVALLNGNQTLSGSNTFDMPINVVFDGTVTTDFFAAYSGGVGSTLNYKFRRNTGDGIFEIIGSQPGFNGYAFDDQAGNRIFTISNGTYGINVKSNFTVNGTTTLHGFMAKATNLTALGNSGPGTNSYFTALFLGSLPLNIWGGGSNNLTIGYGNFIDTNNQGQSYGNVILGGSSNAMFTLFSDCYYSVIVGGHYNTCDSIFSFIGGGEANQISDQDAYDFVGGGYHNLIDSSGTTIPGGEQNYIGQDADGSFIGGGMYNSIGEAGVHSVYSVIPGGISNTVSAPNAWAGGTQSSAMHAGSFVWTDSLGGGMDSTSNQVVFSAHGGMIIQDGNLAVSGTMTAASVGSTNATQTNSFAGPIQTSQILASNLFALGSTTNGYFVLYTNSGVIYAAWFQTNFWGAGGGSQTPWTTTINAGNYSIYNLLAANFSGGLIITNHAINWNGINGVNGGDSLGADGSHTLVWSPGANTDSSHAAFKLTAYPYARIASAYSGSSGSGAAVELNTQTTNTWMSTGAVGAQTGFLMPSNSFSIGNYTNSMANFSGMLISSNGVPVWLYLSNGVPYFYNLSTPAGGFIP